MFQTLMLLAQQASQFGSPVGLIGIGIGMGLVVLGAGLGIGRIGADACSGIARQPEAATSIQINMIIAAALIEGVAFFALIMLNGAKMIEMNPVAGG